MRWKFSRGDQDPRQIDLLAVVALVLVIVGAYAFFADYAPAPTGTTAFVVPSQTVRW